MTMTCWFCPECGYVYREWFGAHMRADREDPCRVAAVKATLVPITDPEADQLDTYDTEAS